VESVPAVRIKQGSKARSALRNHRHGKTKVFLDQADFIYKSVAVNLEAVAISVQPGNADGDAADFGNRGNTVHCKRH
jgi:hypothetical protein